MRIVLNIYITLGLLNDKLVNEDLDILRQTRMWANAHVMATQPNICGALCESYVIPFLVPRRSIADARCWSAVQ